MKKATSPKKATTPRRAVLLSETNIRKAAARVLSVGTIVSTEIHYIQRTLGASATEQELTDHILAVRKMPWDTIAPAE